MHAVKKGLLLACIGGWAVASAGEQTAGVKAVFVPCNADGGFGIRFGKLPDGAKLVTKGNAASWYQVRPPVPDARFDTFQVRARSHDLEVFEVVAVKAITRPPALGEPPIKRELREQGEARAQAFA